MSEYVQPCEKCNGNGWADPEGMAPCPVCRGVRQRLIKPIPEGAVVVTKEKLEEMLLLLYRSDDGCPSEIVYCPGGGGILDDCKACWRKSLTQKEEGHNE